MKHAVGIFLCLVTLVSNAAVTKPNDSVGSGVADIEFNGVIINVEGNFVEAHFQFKGTTYKGEDIGAEGYVRFPIRLDDNTVISTWPIKGKWAETIFTGSIQKENTYLLVDGQGTIHFNGVIEKHLNSTHGISYSVVGTGTLDWQGDLY